MGNKNKTEDFIKKFKNKWGDFLDLSKVNYVNSRTKIKVICPIHGKFLITPNNLLSRGRCPKCGTESVKQVKYSQDEIISMMRDVHGDRYDYSKFVYKGMLVKSEIICHKHGSFWMTPAKHYHDKQNCPKCNGFHKTTEEFISEARTIYGDKYDYSRVSYINATTPIEIICPIHGSFMIAPINHLTNHCGCPKCGRRVMTKEQFIEKARSIHGNTYIYDKVSMQNAYSRVEIICPKHGSFWQTPYKHLHTTQCCPECRNNPISTEDFIRLAKEVHGDRYDYSKTVYIKAIEPVEIICPEHGSFWRTPNNHISKMSGCPKCSIKISRQEDSLYDFVKKMCPDAVQSDRTILEGRELDVYVPSKKVAFEFDGLYWHSELNGKNSSYHLRKTEDCAKKGVKLIHIFEDEWIHKNKLVKNRIKHICGCTISRIYARKCQIKEINSKLCDKFVEKYHLQGNLPAKIRLGLFYKNRLVAVMTFSSPRYNKKYNWELLRYCTVFNFSIIGGAGKLMTHFLKNYSGNIITYADRRWSDGNLYRMLKMKEIGTSKPAYFYVKGGMRYNRIKFQKHKLRSIFSNFDESLSESENMKNNGFHKIYDCGNYIFSI